MLAWWKKASLPEQLVYLRDELFSLHCAASPVPSLSRSIYAVWTLSPLTSHPPIALSSGSLIFKVDRCLPCVVAVVAGGKWKGWLTNFIVNNALLQVD